MENIESRVADTVLQRPEEIKIGDRTYTVAPPSVATLILVSEAVSRMPAIDIDRNRIVQGTLAGAKDCRPLGEILAIMILGAKALSGRQKPSVRISPSAGRDNGQGSLVSGQSGRWKSFLKALRLCSGRHEAGQTGMGMQEAEAVKAELAAELLENLSPKELSALTVKLLSKMQVADFFGLTTFLTGAGLTGRTRKVGGTTASGR